MPPRRKPLKRALDLSMALVALILLAPALLAIALLIRLRLGSPVLFRQERAGLSGRPFRLVKFRTMTDAQDAHGQQKPDAERLTSFGSWLRRTSLDELPELWNVILGDMSLVGPRPLLLNYLPLYSAEQARRHEVRPGLTGWAQVEGRNNTTWPQRLRQDVWYVENQSIWLDLWILARTLGAVVSCRDVSAPDHATMPPFRGETDPEASATSPFAA